MGQPETKVEPTQRYDTIGLGYTTFRRADPRIATQIWAAAGEAGGTVVNVGAGTGSYERSDRSIVAVEPSACPSMTKGELRYDFGDTAMTTPLLMMHTLGHDFMPPPIHAGGLRYHGMAPMVSHALKLGLIEAEAYHQTKVFEAGTLFARSEGIVPAPESSHAIAAVVEEAKKARAAGKKRVILFNLSGHGLLDLNAYETYLTGKLQDA